jgi:transposase
MTEATVRTKTTLHCALELSKSSWLLAIQFPDRPQPSLYRIKGGDAAGLMSQLLIARDRCAKATGEAPSTITLCYEIGYDAFWLARSLIHYRYKHFVTDQSRRNTTSE